MTVERRSPLEYHCLQYGSLSPPRHRKNTYHPPSSPIIVAQAQSTIVSPTRDDSVSLADISPRHDMRRVLLSSPSSRQRLSPDAMTISSSSPSPPHSTAPASTMTCDVPPKLLIRRYPREQLDSQLVDNTSNRNRNVSSLSSSASFRDRHQDCHVFKVPLTTAEIIHSTSHLRDLPAEDTRHHPDQSTVDSVKKNFFFTYDVLQQQKLCPKVTLPSMTRIEEKCPYRPIEDSNEASPLHYIEREPPIAKMKKISISNKSKPPSPDSSPSSSPLPPPLHPQEPMPPPLQLLEPTPKLELSQYSIIDYSKPQYNSYNEAEFISSIDANNEADNCVSSAESTSPSHCFESADNHHQTQPYHVYHLSNIKQEYQHKHQYHEKDDHSKSLITTSDMGDTGSPFPQEEYSCSASHAENKISVPRRSSTASSISSVSSSMSSLPPIVEGEPLAETNSGNLIAVIDKLIIGEFNKQPGNKTRLFEAKKVSENCSYNS